MDRKNLNNILNNARDPEDVLTELIDNEFLNLTNAVKYYSSDLFVLVDLYAKSSDDELDKVLSATILEQIDDFTDGFEILKYMIDEENVNNSLFIEIATKILTLPASLRQIQKLFLLYGYDIDNSVQLDQLCAQIALPLSRTIYDFTLFICDNKNIGIDLTNKFVNRLYALLDSIPNHSETG